METYNRRKLFDDDDDTECKASKLFIYYSRINKT